MRVFVVMHVWRGLLEEVKVFLSADSARKAEQTWLRQQEIEDEMTRESKAGDGTEAFVRECEVKP